MCINGDVRLDGELQVPVQHRCITRLAGSGCFVLGMGFYQWHGHQNDRQPVGYPSPNSR